jgi:hypothetical protein
MEDLHASSGMKTRLNKIQKRPGLLDGFLASTGLGLAPFQ